MTSERRFYASLFLPEQAQPTPAALISLVATGPMQSGTLAYGLRYIDRPDGLDLNPAHLPRRADEYPLGPARMRDGGAMNLTLRDALPDAWGRRVLAAANGGREVDDVEALCLTNADRVGAMVFYPHAQIEPDALTVPTHTLAALHKAAEEIARGEAVSRSMQAMLNPGMSLGGARPKATLLESDTLWLAKFESPSDTVDVQRVEAGTLTLARLAGIRAPDHHVQQVGRKSVLLLRRFDRPGAASAGLRTPYLSAAALTNCAYESDQGSYLVLAEHLRKYGSDPRADLEELFARLLFNLLIDNTDDHVKNHGVLHDHNNLYRLSPAFDLVPQLTNLGYQGMRIAPDSHNSDLDLAMAQYAAYGLTAKTAHEVLTRIRQAVAQAPAVYERAGVSAATRKQLQACFAHQARLIAGGDAGREI